MIFLKFVPGALKELLKHVPTVLFQVVDWGELMAELPVLSRRLIHKEGQPALLDHLAPQLAVYNIELTQTPLEKRPYRADRWSAERCLHLYFAQLFSSQGLFLDLRSFHFEAEPPKLKWHPTGLWTKFNEDFREGLIEVYDGFYQDDDTTYFRGLRRIGLVGEDWPEEEKKELGDLFRAQFGAGESETSFDLENFRDAIFKMTDFLLKKKVKITKDFLYLGIYLVALYSHLEESGETLPVKDIYLQIRSSK